MYRKSITPTPVKYSGSELENKGTQTEDRNRDSTIYNQRDRIEIGRSEW